MSALARFVADMLAEEERLAQAATPGPWTHHGLLITDARNRDVVGPEFGGGGITHEPDGDHIAHHDPARALALVAAGRAILAEVASWQHRQEGDEYYSCSQAAEPGGAPGSGCYDDERAGEPCDCGLDARRHRMLSAFALTWAGHERYDEKWRPE